MSVISSGTINTLQFYPDQGLMDPVESRHHFSEFESPQERYIYRCVKNLVDDVCLYYGKKETLEKRSSEFSNKDHSVILNNIPLKAVPLNLDSNNPAYRFPIKAQIENEVNELAGYFGWCTMCRSQANLYCKETRVSVCSLECKIAHLKELSQILSFSVLNFLRSTEKIQKI